MGFSLGDAVVFFRGDDSQLSKDIDGAETKTKSFVSNATGLLGGVLAGGAIAAGAAIVGVGTAAFDVSQQVGAATSDIAAKLGIPKEEARGFAEVARDVYGKNFGESVGHAAEAVTLLAQQMKLTADDPSLPRMTENALKLQKVFGVEINESVDAVRTLMENFGITSDEAFDLLAAGYQRGLDRSGDFLDTIGEYSTQFANGGATVEEFFGLLDSGLQGGMLGTDKAADAFKEFRVRIADGSTLTADSLKMIGLSVDDITAGMSNGTLSAADAFKLVQDALRATDDPVVRFQAGVGLLGTQFEDLGDKVASGLNLTGDWAAGTEGAIDTLNAKYTGFGSMFESLWRRLIVSVSPLTDKLLELANNAMPVVMDAFDRFDSLVGPAVERVGNIIGDVVNFVKGLFQSDLSGSVTIATGIFDKFKQRIDEIMPYVQTLITNVLGFIQSFWSAHGETIMALVDNAWSTIGTIISTTLDVALQVIKLFLQVLTGDWEGASQTLQDIVQTLWDGISAIFDIAIENIKLLFGSIDWGEIGKNILQGIANGITGALSIITEAARGAAESAYNTAKGWLGIESPSKKAAEGIGRPYVQGIVQGIDEEIRNAKFNLQASIENLVSSVQGPQSAPVLVSVDARGANDPFVVGKEAGESVRHALRMRGG